MRSQAEIEPNQVLKMKQVLNGILPRFYLSEVADELIIYSENELTLDQFGRFVQFIKDNKKITKLYFDGMPFDDSSLKILAHTLMDNDHITELTIKHPKNLSQSGAGTAAIITLLSQSNSLSSLNLVDCRLGSVQALALADAIAKNKILKKLSLDVDEIGPNAATAILKAANIHQSLTYLSFWNVGLNDELDDFGKALAANHSLTELILICNKQINDQGAIYLATHLKKNKMLKCLKLYGSILGSNIGQNGIAALQKVFKKNYWMNEIGIDHYHDLKRTPEERVLQIERESPAVNLKGDGLMLSSLTNIMPVSGEIDFESYLNNFEDAPEDYRLSYVDCFKLIRFLGPTIKHPLLTNFFNSPYFFETFFRLDDLSLINKNNFKVFCCLTEKEKMILYGLFHSVDTDAMNVITVDQRRCLDILLPHSKPLLHALFTILIEQTFFSKHDLLALVSLSITNIERLHEIVNGLFKNNLLTNNAWRASIIKVTDKKPTYFESDVDKISRKNTPSEDNSKIIINQSLTLFTEHNVDKKYHKGTFGKVKKGWDSEGTIYSIKKLATNINDNDDAKKCAESNMHANHLLGRENAWFFKRNGFYSIVSIWQSEKCIEEFKKEILIKEPAVNRFRCIIDGLSQVERLHSEFHIHGDIKPRNFIINLTQKTMKLIDLDGVRKKGSHRKHTPHTKYYMDFKEFVGEKQSFPDDVYAMGLTIEELFPDLFNKKYKKDKNTWTPIDYVIDTLVSAMTRDNREKRCTIQNALSFCHQIKTTIDKLDNDSIHTIAHQTITNNQLSVEDVVRGRTRLTKK